MVTVRGNKLDRWILLGLATIVVLAALGMILPGLATLLMLTLVLLPIGLALSAAPTALLWLGPTLAAYLLARRIGAGPFKASLTGLLASVATLATITYLPRQANRETLAAARVATATAVPTRVASGPVETLIDLRPDWDISEDGEPSPRCTWRCERALFSGFAKRYALGRATAFDVRSPVQRVAIVHELVPAERGCDVSMLLGARAEDGDFPIQTRRSQLYLRDALNGSGYCVRSRRADRISGDLILVEHFDAPSLRDERKANYDWRLHRIGSEVLEVHRRAQGELRLAARHVRLHYDLLAVPLAIQPPFAFTVHTPGGWMTGPAPATGRDVPVDLPDILNADLTVDYLDAG